MPNWCRNILEITGNNSDLEAFANAAAGFSRERNPELAAGHQVLDFEKLLPIPEDVLGGDYPQARLSWERANWGCALGAYRPRMEHGKNGSLSYFFETRWTPHLKLIGTVSLIWEGLVFRISFAEEMGNFAGEVVAKAGGLAWSFFKKDLITWQDKNSSSHVMA